MQTMGLLTWTSRLLLLMVPWTKRGLAVLHAWAHSVHRLPLLRTLVGHHRGDRAPWTRVPIRAWSLWRSTVRHELGVASRIHHLWVPDHALRPRHEVWLHHHRAPHLTMLGHVLVREVAVLVHLGSPGPHVGRLAGRNLRWGVHGRVGHGCRRHAR